MLGSQMLCRDGAVRVLPGRPKPLFGRQQRRHPKLVHAFPRPNIHRTLEQILLPYMIGALFGVGYGSVVAAGGWEALRVPVNANCAVAAGSEAAAGGERRGSIGGAGGDVGAAGDLHGTSSDISFAAQVCARDTRAEQEANAQIDEDDDEDFESSGAGSDNDDDIHAEERRGGGGGGVDPQATVAAATKPATKTAAVTRSQTRNAGSSSDSDVGDSGAETGRGSDPVGFESGEDERAGPDARHPLLPGREGVGDSVPPADGLSLVHQASSYDSTEGEDDEEEEEDRGGWGQVVVKPVKVARWDKQGQRSKAQLSLNQLRALILERAESTPQRATYRRAARLVSERAADVACVPIFVPRRKKPGGWHVQQCWCSFNDDTMAYIWYRHLFVY